MSNLIVMPGSKEFAETLAKTTKPARKKKVLAPPVDLIGRTLMLNTAVAAKFQCGGFQLSQRRLVAVVTHEAQQIPLHIAIKAGTLVDVTDKDMTKGYKGKGGETSAITEEDTGQKVYVQKDQRGNAVVIIPKSKKQAKSFDKEISSAGRITSVDIEAEVCGISGIHEEDLVEEKPKSLPKKQPVKKAAHGSSPNRSGRSRR